jgi:RNA polymerase sigma-70 factor, ECF subfamily
MPGPTWPPACLGFSDLGVSMIDFGALYRKYAPDVFRFALYLSGNPGDAEDITSETFVRAWTSPEPIEIATVKGYLFTIARRLFLMGLRKTSRLRELDVEPSTTAPGPHEEAEGKEKLKAVLAALQRLPEVDRAALLLRALEEMPYEEIARALGVSLTSAKVKVHRARLALQETRNS